MNNTMNAAEVMLDTLSAVMGDYAPRKRRLLLDFKDDHGQDRNMDAIVWHNPKTTDETVVRMLKEQLCSDGGRLSAISEVLEDGTGYCLYCAPGFLEETMMEHGYPVPADMKAAMEKSGFHPINWEELVNGKKILPAAVCRGRRQPCGMQRRIVRMVCAACPPRG